MLRGVAAVSSRDAWAVGSYLTSGPGAKQSYRTLILRWDATAWDRVASPSPGTADNFLYGVAAVSSRDAWAVGEYDDGSLILHWDGTAWHRVASPGPRTGLLSSVAALSSRDAWAVGYYNLAGFEQARTLILHWDGTAWRRVASPSPGTADNYLYGVAAVSSRDAWAVGDDLGRQGYQALVLHWDGTAWRRVASPSPGDSYLNAVAATSPGNAWAVGGYSIDPDAPPQRTLILRWDGTVWRRVASPSPGTADNFLTGVAALSSRDAWAVGSGGQTLILRWDGTVWRRAASPNPAFGDGLLGVAAISPGNAWAVGAYTVGDYISQGPGPDRTLILHCGPSSAAGSTTP